MCRSTANFSSFARIIKSGVTLSPTEFNKSADSPAERSTPINCAGAITSVARGDGDKQGEVDDQSSVRPKNNGSTPEGQGGEQVPFGTPPVSAPGSGPGYDRRPRNFRPLCSLLTRLQPRTPTLHEKADHPVSGPPPPPDALSSEPHAQTQPHGGAIEDVRSSCSGQDKEKADNRDADKGDGENGGGNRGGSAE